MIGPRTQEMPDRLVCTDCDVVISHNLGGTARFPKERMVNYCKHPGIDTEIAFIKGFPYTPKWCPVLKGDNLTSRRSRAAEACACPESNIYKWYGIDLCAKCGLPPPA